MLDLDSDYLGEEHLMLRDQFRKYVQSEIVPKTEEWETLGSLPKSAYLALGELGFLGVSIPEDRGGAGFDTLGTVVFGEELGRSGNGGFAGAISDHADITVPIIARLGTPQQCARFLPDILSGQKIAGLAVTEPRGGSDLTRMATTARRDGDFCIG